MKLKKYTIGDTSFYFIAQYGGGYGWFNGNMNKMYRIPNRIGYSETLTRKEFWI